MDSTALLGSETRSCAPIPSCVKLHRLASVVSGSSGATGKDVGSTAGVNAGFFQDCGIVFIDIGDF